MKFWQLQIAEGNIAFESEHYCAAITHYLNGLNQLMRIEQLICSDSPPPKAWVIDQYLPALIVSYLNLCDCKLAQNKIESACELLESGYQKARNFTASCIQKNDYHLHNLVLRHLCQLKKYAFVLAKQTAHKPALLLKLNTIINTQIISNNTIH